MAGKKHILDVKGEPIVEWEEHTFEEKKGPDPLPEDQTFLIKFMTRARVGGHQFMDGDVCGQIKLKYGLSPRTVFAMMGKLYKLEIKQ